MDGAHGEFGLGFNELGHGIGEAGEVALVHGLGVLEARRGPNETDVREGVDAELGEGELGLLELDVAEEELGVGRVVGEEGGGDDGEFVAELGEAELRLVVELCGVKEKEDGVRARGFHGGEEAGEGLVVQPDYARFGSGLQGEQFAHSLVGGGHRGGDEHHQYQQRELR